METKKFEHLIESIEALKVSKDEMLILRSKVPMCLLDDDILGGFLKTLGEQGVHGILLPREIDAVGKTDFEKFIIRRFVEMAEQSLDPEQFDRLKGMVWELCKNRSCLDEEFHTEVCKGSEYGS